MRGEDIQDSSELSQAGRAKQRLSRRTWLQTLGSSIVVTGCIGTASAGQDTSVHWPRFRGPTNRLFTTSQNNPEQSPTLQWRVQTSAAPVPISIDGTVYAAQDDGKLIAVDEETGGKLTLFQMPADTTGLEYRDGRLYVIDAENTVATVGTETGKVWWRRTLSDTISGFVVFQDTLLVGTTHGEIVVLNRSNGATRRRVPAPFEVDEEAAFYLFRNGTTVYGGVWDHGVFSWNVPENTYTWTQTFSGTAGYPALAGDTLFTVGYASESTYELRALNAATGEPRWSQSVAVGNEWGGFVVGEQRLYFGGNEGIVALDRQSGQQVWSSGLQPVPGVMFGTPSTLYVVVEDQDELIGVNPQSGVEKWRFTFRGSGSGKPPAPTQHGLAIGYGENLYLFDGR